MKIILSKNIKRVLAEKIESWADSIQDKEIADLIRNETIITGGSIVSLLQDENPHDYDIYFRTIDSLQKVSEYYVKKFMNRVDENGNQIVSNSVNPKVQKCTWSDNKWHVLCPGENPKDKEVRLRVFVRSAGAVGQDFNAYNEEIQFRKECAKIGETIKSSIVDIPKNSYLPIFLSANAITLSDKIQLILRFYGEPEEIHKNYDFVHCTCYYTSWNNKLVLPARALEAIINKELYYIGSKYPLCSLVRTRKFISRGWKINAGQYVKMALQLNDLDLKNLHVFEEQLIGVDSYYFYQVIENIYRDKKKDKDLEIDSAYLIKLVNEVFDGE